MTFRLFALVALAMMGTAFGQVDTTPVNPVPGAGSQASVGQSAVDDADDELSPNYRAPAPPIDQDDSNVAMSELDDSKAIKVGDRLEYTVLEDREPPEVLLVDEDGNVDVPLLGDVSAVGQTARQFARKVSDALKQDFYYQATVLVSEHEGNARRGMVIVMGEVNKEGMVEIPSGDILRVSDAIMRAGGFTVYADSSRVSLIRPNPKNPEASERFDVNVAQILETGRLDQDIIVRANDRIFVARRGDTSGQYTISGAVNRPGVYPISIGQKIRLSEAILTAGGFTQFGDGSDVKLIRFDEEGNRDEQEIDVEEILEKGRMDTDVLLKPSDRIIVGEKWIKF